MTIRRPTLDEWFNAYQHRRMWRERSYMVGSMTVDATAVVADWTARGERPSWSAILARACGLAVREHPDVNRTYLRTLWGDRVITFDGAHVTMPIQLDAPDGRKVLTAVVLRDADQRAALDLKAEIRGHLEAGLEGTRVTKWVARRPNRWWWRLALRALWFVAWRLARVEAHGGAIGVSCPVPSTPWDGPVAHFAGPTPVAMLISLSGVRPEGDRVWLDLGVMADHLTVDGATLGAYLRTLGRILEGDPEALR